jgi:toxin ParE1/3/4
VTRLVITPQAECDIEEIGDYIARDNVPRALSFIRELRAQCEKIAALPEAFRLRQELGEDIRSCAHGRYVIFFTVGVHEVTIIRILHGARDLSALFPDEQD